MKAPSELPQIQDPLLKTTLHPAAVPEPERRNQEQPQVAAWMPDQKPGRQADQGNQPEGRQNLPAVSTAETVGSGKTEDELLLSRQAEIHGPRLQNDATNLWG